MTAAPVTETRPVPVILTATATVVGLTIRRLEPDAAGARPVLDEVAFDTLFPWIDTLERRHAQRLGDLDLARRLTSGLVSATPTERR